MSVSLSKGGNVSLTKEAPGLTDIAVGLGWAVRTTDGSDFDLDASALVCGTDGKVLSDDDFVFYNNKTAQDGAVKHSGDDRTGGAEGDDETILVNLAALGGHVEKVVVVVSIDQAEERHQNFGQVNSAYVRIVNSDNNTEVTRFDLGEDASTETALVFGEVYRNGSDWKFRAIAQGYSSGLGGIARDFGVNVG